MEVLLIFLVFIGGVIFVARPLFQPSGVGISKTDAEIAGLESEKLSLYHQIKQVDMEYDLNLLSEEDYLASRRRLKLEASQVIGKINALKPQL